MEKIVKLSELERMCCSILKDTKLFNNIKSDIRHEYGLLKAKFSNYSKGV